MVSHPLIFAIIIALIVKLKEMLRLREQELAEKEDENFLKMKELQLSINTLLTHRSKKHPPPISLELDPKSEISY